MIHESQANEVIDLDVRTYHLESENIVILIPSNRPSPSKKQAESAFPQEQARK